MFELRNLVILPNNNTFLKSFKRTKTRCELLSVLGTTLFPINNGLAQLQTQIQLVYSTKLEDDKSHKDNNLELLLGLLIHFVNRM